MTDQATEQNNQINSETTPVSIPEVTPVAETVQPVSQYSSVVPSPVIAVSNEPFVAPTIAGGGIGMSDSPTVVVSGNGGGAPKWFYLVFGLTLIVFIAVTTMLILSLTKKQSVSQPPPVNNVAPTIFRPTEVVLPQPSILPQATDSAGLILPGSSSDEIDSLENEVNSADLSTLDNDLSTIDNELSAP